MLESGSTRRRLMIIDRTETFWTSQWRLDTLELLGGRAHLRSPAPSCSLPRGCASGEVNGSIRPARSVDGCAPRAVVSGRSLPPTMALCKASGVAWEKHRGLQSGLELFPDHDAGWARPSASPLTVAGASGLCWAIVTGGDVCRTSRILQSSWPGRVLPQ